MRLSTRPDCWPTSTSSTGADARLCQRQTARHQRQQPQRRTHGPIREDITWQGKADEGFAIDGFLIDWDAHTAICTQGQRSVRWKPHRQQRPGYWQTNVFLDRNDCTACPARSKMHPLHDQPASGSGTTPPAPASKAPSPKG